MVSIKMFLVSCRPIYTALYLIPWNLKRNLTTLRFTYKSVIEFLRYRNHHDTE